MDIWPLLGCLALEKGVDCAPLQLPAARIGASCGGSGEAWEEAVFPHSALRAWWACLQADLGVSDIYQLWI